MRHWHFEMPITSHSLPGAMSSASFFYS